MMPFDYSPRWHGPMSTSIEFWRDEWHASCSFDRRGWHYSARIDVADRDEAESWLAEQTSPGIHQWRRSPLYAPEWAGPNHPIEGKERRGAASQWEPPRVVHVRREIPGIDTDGRYETGRVESYRRRWAAR